MQGTDTSSTAIASTLFYLSNTPEAYAKACAEVREKFPRADDVQPGGLLNPCRYLRACVKEAMRLSPPVSSALWREVQGTGLNIDGTFIPAGCVVGVPIYAIHHHSGLYHQPFDYIPERWLGNMALEAQTAFNPFSFGPRSCVGKSLALRETQYILARILATFEFERTTIVEEEYNLKEHVTSSKNGPFLRFSYT